MQTTLARGIVPAQTPALTAQAPFLLVDEELVRQNVTTGATLEAHSALQALETRGVLRVSGEGYVARQPS